MGSPTSNPRVNVQLLPSAVVDAFADRRNLIVGQTGTGGTATTLALVQDVHLLTEAQIKVIFGSDELFWRIKAWRSGIQVTDGGKIPSLDVIGVDAAAGTAATGTVAFTGTATADGSFTVSVVDEEQLSVTVAVTSGDTNTVVAAAIDAAIDNLVDAPFTPSNLTGTLTLTANDVGTIGNFYGIKVSGAAAGLTYVITGFASGATDPTVTTILDAIDGRRYTGLNWPEFWQTDLSIAKTEFDNRFNVSNGIMDGVVFHGRSATFANAQTAVSTHNSQSLVIGGNNLTTAADQKGAAILTPVDWIWCYFMGVRAKRLTTGALVGDLITATNAQRDATGSPALASLPYFNTPLPDAPVTLSAGLYSSSEQVTLEDAGFSTYGVNRAGNNMLTGGIVTTWVTDGAGNPNDSFHYLNFVDTASAAREIFFTTLKATYAQSRLTEGDLVAGRSIANVHSIKSELMKIYRVLANLVLVQDGNQAEQYFSDNTTVKITGGSLSNRGVTINGILPIVTQIGTIDYNMSLAFSLGQDGTLITV